MHEDEISSSFLQLKEFYDKNFSFIDIPLYIHNICIDLIYYSNWKEKLFYNFTLWWPLSFNCKSNILCFYYLLYQSSNPQDIILSLYISSINNIKNLILLSYELERKYILFLISLLSQIDLSWNNSYSKHCPFDNISKILFSNINNNEKSLIYSFYYNWIEESNKNLYSLYNEALNNKNNWINWLENRSVICFDELLSHNHYKTIFFSILQNKIESNIEWKNWLLKLSIHAKIRYINECNILNGLSEYHYSIIQNIIDTSNINLLNTYIKKYKDIFISFLTYINSNNHINIISFNTSFNQSNNQSNISQKILYINTLSKLLNISIGKDICSNFCKPLEYLSFSNSIVYSSMINESSEFMITQDHFVSIWILINNINIINTLLGLNTNNIIQKYNEIIQQIDILNIKQINIYNDKTIFINFISSLSWLWRNITNNNNNNNLNNNNNIFKILGKGIKISSYLLNNIDNNNTKQYSILIDSIDCFMYILLKNINLISKKQLNDIFYILSESIQLLSQIQIKIEKHNNFEQSIKDLLEINTLKLSCILLQYYPKSNIEKNIIISKDNKTNISIKYPIISVILSQDNKISLLTTNKHILWSIIHSILICCNWHPDIIVLICNIIDSIGSIESLYSDININNIIKYMENNILLKHMDKEYIILYNFINDIIQCFTQFNKDNLIKKRLLRLLGELSYISFSLYIIIQIDPIPILLQNLQRNNDETVRENTAIMLSLIIPIILSNEDNNITNINHLNLLLKKRLLQSCSDKRVASNIIHQGINQNTSNTYKLNNLCLETLSGFLIKQNNKECINLQNSILIQISDERFGLISIFKISSFTYDKLFKPSKDTAIYYINIIKQLIEDKILKTPLLIVNVIEKFLAINFDILYSIIDYFETLINICSNINNICIILKRKGIHKQLEHISKLIPQNTKHYKILLELSKYISLAC